MANRERAREYNPREESTPIIEMETPSESERTPERSVGLAFSTVEDKENKDTSSWREKAKDFFNTPAGKGVKYTGIGVGVGGIGLVGLMAYELIKLKVIFQFAKKMIEKKGKMTFAEGYEIGRSISPIGREGKQKNKK